MKLLFNYTLHFLLPLFIIFFNPSLACLSILFISSFLYMVRSVFLYYKLGLALYWFLFLFFVTIPLFQLTTESIAYVEMPMLNDIAYIYLAAYNILIIASFCILSYLYRRKIVSKNINYAKLTLNYNIKKSKKPLFILSLISLAFFLYFLVRFGGISGLTESYNERLLSSVTEYNPLAGAGVIQAFANLFPVFFGIYLLTFIKNTPSKIRLTMIVFVTLLLSFIVSGIFGSRQGVLFAAFGVLWSWHFIIKPFNNKELGYFLCFACIFMLIAMPLKFFGFNFNFEMINEFNDMRGIDVAFGPFGFLMIRDVGRFDVNLFVMDEYLNNSFDLGFGQTILQGLLMAIPGGLFDNLLMTPTELKSSIFLGNYIHYATDSTLLLGLPGELLINFGFIGAFIFGSLVFLIMYTGQVFFNNIDNSPSVVFLYTYIIPLVFLVFLFDSNVIAYYLVRWVFLFSVPMYFFTKNR